MYYKYLDRYKTRADSFFDLFDGMDFMIVQGSIENFQVQAQQYGGER